MESSPISISRLLSLSHMRIVHILHRWKLLTTSIFGKRPKSASPDFRTPFYIRNNREGNAKKHRSAFPHNAKK